VSEALAPGGTVDVLLAALRWPEAASRRFWWATGPRRGLGVAYRMNGPRLTYAATEALLPWSLNEGGVLVVGWLRHRPREDRGDAVLVPVRR
jgi:phosphohistidine phosphatase